MRYFVKSFFSGWHEVSKEKFDAFVQHLKSESTAVPENKKQELIDSKTRIEP